MHGNRGLILVRRREWYGYEHGTGLVFKKKHRRLVVSGVRGMESGVFETRNMTGLHERWSDGC